MNRKMAKRTFAAQSLKFRLNASIISHQIKEMLPHRNCQAKPNDIILACHKVTSLGVDYPFRPANQTAEKQRARYKINSPLIIANKKNATLQMWKGEDNMSVS